MTAETPRQESSLATVDMAVCRRFEAAFRKGSPESIESVLPPEGPYFLATLEELVHIDLELRWREVAKAATNDGEGTVHRPPPIESYLTRFPVLNTPPILRRLIKQELKARRSSGERGTVEEYRKRFPDLVLSGQDVEPVPTPEQRDEAALPQIPGYEVLEVLGRGGMGVVYRAKQTALGRQVALKMILAGDHAAGAERARFRSEAEAVASLQHPNIVQIFEIGEQAGCPFFSLEYVDGGTLDKQIAGTPQDPRNSVRLLETLARAVHFAHQRGIVHRDLKPANVLLQKDEGGRMKDERDMTAGSDSSFLLPLSSFLPKIADFGLAKRLEGQGETRTGDILGTPSYMAPEQAEGKVREIGPATDVYALGGILYSMLTGRPPFCGATSFDTLHQVLNTDTVPPSKLVPKLPRDLETICLKCLEKDSGKRYESAEALAEDLGRFLEDHPIMARPVHGAERLWRWCRRKPLVATLIAGVVVSLLAGTSVSAVLAVRAHHKAVEASNNEENANNQKVRADLEADAAKASAEVAKKRKLQSDWRLYISNIRLAHHDWRDAGIDRMRTLLHAHRHPEKDEPDPRGFEWHFLDRLTRADLFTFTKHTGGVTSVAFSHDGKRVASAGHGEVVIWSPLTGQEIRLRDSAFCNSLAFSSDGKYLAGGSSNESIKIWNPESGKLIHTLQKLPGRVSSVAFSPDGQLLAAACDPQEGPSNRGTIRIFTTNSFDGFRVLPGLSYPSGLSFSADGKRLACATREASAKVWEVATGKELLSVGKPMPAAGAVALSPDGKRLATASWTGLRLWNADTGEELMNLHGHTSTIHQVRFSPDGKFLASASFDRTVRVWNVEAGHEVYALRGHTSYVNCVSFSPDGQSLASGSLDGQVKVWRAAPQEYRPVTQLAQGIAYSQDGRRIAAVGRVWDDKLQKNIGGEVKIWEAATGKQLVGFQAHSGPINGTAFSPDGRHLATASDDRTITLWDAETGRAIRSFEGHTGPVKSVAFSSDGQRLASASSDQSIRIWNTATGESMERLSDVGFPEAVAYWGQFIAAACGQDVKIWDATSGKLLHTLKGHTNSVSCIAFSPGGVFLASGSWDKTVRVWNVTHGREEFLLKGHTNFVNSVAFGSAGRLASGSLDQTVRIWETRTGEELLTLTHQGGVSRIAFDRAGRQLASAGYDHTVRIWDGTPQP